MVKKCEQLKGNLANNFSGDTIYWKFFKMPHILVTFKRNMSIFKKYLYLD